MEGRVDVPRLIADDVHLDVGGQDLREPGQVLLDRLDHGHRVLARLAPHVQDDGRRPVHADGGALLLGAVLRLPDVAHADRRPVDGGDDQVVERPGVDHPPHGPERLLLPARRDVAAGEIGVLPDDGVADGGDRDLVGGQPVGLDPDVDGALQAADQLHLADAQRPLEVDLHRLVGELRQLAQAAVAGDGQGEDRRLVVVELGDGRRPDVAGQDARGVQDLVTDVLGRHVHGPAEREGDGDVARAGPGERPELRDALDGVDGLLDLLGDLRLHLLDGGAGQLGADAHRGQLDGREAVDARAGSSSRCPRRRARARSSSRTPAGGCRLRRASALISPYFSTVTAWPPVRLPAGSTTGWPAFTPETISIAVAEPAAGGDAQLLALAVPDREHLLHAGERDERRRRHRHDAPVRLDDHLGPGERAGPQAARGVGDLRLDGQRPVLLGDRRRQARHRPRVHRRVAVDRDAHGLPPAHVRGLALRDREPEPRAGGGARGSPPAPRRRGTHRPRPDARPRRRRSARGSRCR